MSEMATRLEKIQDAGEAKNMKKALIEDANMAQKYLDVAGTIFVVIGADQRIRLINKKGCAVLNCEGEDIIGLNWFDTFIPERIRGELKGVFEKLTGGELASVEYYENPVLTRNDEERIIAWHNTLLTDEQGKIYAILSSGDDITDHKKLEEAALKAETKFHTLFNSFPDAIFIVNMEGCFLDVNQAACERLGYSHEELLQMGPADIDAPEYAAKVPERIKTMLEQDSLIFESAHVRRDGVRIPIELNGRVVEYDGRPTIIGIARDITERKKAEAQIKDSEERFRNLAEQSPNMIFINKRGKVAYVNAKCEEVMKYKRVEFYSPDFDFLCLIAPEFVELVRSKLDKHQRGEEVEPFEYAIVSKDDKRIEVILNSRLIYYEGEKAILGIITDVTELKNAEDKLKKAYQELETAQEASLNIMEDLERERKKLGASLREREVLLRELHHRVKNNIQLMSSLTRLHARTITDSRYSGIFKDMFDRIKAMSLIHEKLYGSEDMGRIGFRDYIRSLVGDLCQTYDIAEGRISLKTDVEMPDIDIDKAIPMGLIINELITNSIKYAFPGDRAGEIIITIRPVSENEVELLVADNGIGIPEALDVRNTKTFGMQLVTTLAEDQLKGIMEISRNNGTEFSIRFKYR